MASNKTARTERIKKWCQMGKTAYEAGNHEDAIRWYEKAAHHGNLEVMCLLGDLYYEEDTDDSYENARKWYKKVAARETNPRVFERLGKMYHYGYGVEKNYYEALQWYQKAVDAGSIDTMHLIADLYDIGGNGIQKNTELAIEWYQKAVDAGDTDAMNDLVFLYFDKKDYKKTVEWYSKAVSNEVDNGVSSFFLFQIYSQGLGVPKDDKKAVECLAKAAQKGDAYSMYLFAEYNRYVEKDYSKAWDMYWGAIKQGNLDAMIEMARWLLNGDNIKRNPNKAIELIEYAFQRRHPRAIYLVGRLYLCGLGVERKALYGNSLVQQAAAAGDNLAKDWLNGKISNDEF